jgi:hypothetical protein
LLTDLLTRALDGLGEDVSDTDGMLAQHMRVDAQGHCGVGVAETSGHRVDGDPDEEQRGRVEVADQPWMMGFVDCRWKLEVPR